MCIGVPMRVALAEGGQAWCDDDGRSELLDMRLVGDQPVGTWVLAFMGAARQVLSEHDAANARAARQALAAVLQGTGGVDAFFADLVGREPQLPEHLLRSTP
jgi:hydrogenase expression/formation protein HypC